MNIDITFRAYDKKRKEWLLWYKTIGGFSLFGETMLFGEWAAILDLYLFERDGRKQEDLVVEQLHNTLTRKAGAKIYVGDIISHDLEEGLGQPKQVKQKSTVHSVEFDYGFYSNVRLIGNIHDNPPEPPIF